MLRNLPEKHNSRWRDHLNKVVHAYSCTKNDSTGYAPFFLLFARPLPLPIDLMFYHKPPTGFSSHPEYVRKSKCYVRSLQDSFRTCPAEYSARKQYHKKVRYIVLIKNLFFSKELNYHLLCLETECLFQA